ncbi:YqaA family protein [Roseospira navarrensis]|uniref:DedA family protein n=1 Tax=Roseospira navarrensis TaxID=140058 RepID=A0A7X1ZHY6_9PROT|nr:VTT domain-containing protein [Roseospira navarrensis]MQX37951.1 DedA family protein [Roseospira navarrensis]
MTPPPESVRQTRSGDGDAAAGVPVGQGRARKLVQRLQTSRTALRLLFAGSVLESTVVPIPLEAVMLPFMVLNPARVWAIATAALAGCLLGALLGYAVGLLFMQTVGQGLIEWAGWTESFAAFQDLFAAQGFWAILAIGVLPIPFQVAMLAAGAAGYPVLWFMLATVLARGVRYHGMALLVRLYGRQATDLWRRNKPAALAVAAAVIAGLWAVIQGLSLLVGPGAQG